MAVIESLAGSETRRRSLLRLRESADIPSLYALWKAGGIDSDFLRLTPADAAASEVPEGRREAVRAIYESQPGGRRSILQNVWQSTGLPDAGVQAMALEMFRAAAFLTDHDDPIPDTLTLYRGQDCLAREPGGIEWATNRLLARWYAGLFADRAMVAGRPYEPTVVGCTVARDHVLGHFDHCGEVIAEPAHVRLIGAWPVGSAEIDRSFHATVLAADAIIASDEYRQMKGYVQGVAAARPDPLPPFPQ